jgi:hypothetical protein
MLERDAFPGAHERCWCVGMSIRCGWSWVWGWHRGGSDNADAVVEHAAGCNQGKDYDCNPAKPCEKHGVHHLPSRKNQ